MSIAKFLNPELLYFTSDHHFGHKNICKYSNRPFDSCQDMEERFIENWNKVVQPDGIVFHLGDMFFQNLEKCVSVIKRLNGRIIYLYGNHEVITKTSGSIFHSTQDYLRIKVLDEEVACDFYQDIVLMHYPIASWEKKHYGSWMLHGHCHGSFDNGPNSLDVGVDSVAKLLSDTRESYKPLDYYEVKNLIYLKSK